MNTPRDFMKMAIDLSREKMKQGKGGPFGAILVKDGSIVAKGYNKVTSENDPTMHAEIVAIREGCKKLNVFKLKGCALYSSCEPCPMCLSAIYWAGIDRVYYAANRDDAQRAGFQDKMLYKEITLPLQSRKIPMKQLLQTEANLVVDEWISKEDKILY